MPASDLWGRRVRLLIEGETEVIDLSECRISFQTRNADTMAPNTLYVRVYNLSQSTASRIANGKIEYKTITLEAGYQGSNQYGQNYGVIFHGTVKQTAVGKESPVDSYVDLWAADGDVWHNQATINKAFAAGVTQKEVFEAVYEKNASLPYANDASGYLAGIPPTALLRGKVLFGMARAHGRNWMKNNDFSVSIQSGKVTMTPVRGYRQGEAVVLNARTGLIGVPEATQDGVMVQCLLNPKLHIGNLVKIEREAISRITGNTHGLTYGLSESVATTTDEGIYRVLTCEHVGDTRATPWYSRLTCLAVDATAPKDRSVAP